jgi:hypothetical protein
MDPELMQLFLNARGRNKNVSGVLGNLDNPLLAYLAGAYNPMTQEDSGGGSTSTWDTYYGNEQYPELQPVLDIIAQGGDEYQAQAALDAAVANGGRLGPFSFETAKSLVSDAYKEVSEGGPSGKKSVFAKAGLSDPLDEYTVETMPMDETIRGFLSTLSKDSSRLAELASGAKKDAKRLKDYVSVGDTFLDSYRRKLRKEMGSAGGNIPGMAIRNLLDSLENKKSISNEELAQLESRFTPQGYKDYQDMYKTSIGRASKGLVNRGTTEDDTEKLSKAERKANDLYYLAKEQADAERQIQEGILAAYKKAGKTPLQDELSSMMKFISATK